MTLPVVFTANGPSGYNLTKSLRFRSSASAYLNRTPATATNRKTWTWSGWVKRGALSGSTDFALFSAYGSNDDSGFWNLRFRMDANTNCIAIGIWNNDQRNTTALYRDSSAWYHIVCAVDTTQATATNRTKLYVNGVQVTSFTTENNVAQNTDLAVNNTISHKIGADYTGRFFLDGYLAEINFIDGQALTPSSFGSTNALTGVWQPAKYTGTYGTNGFYLPFTDNSATTPVGLGKDFSGNSGTAIVGTTTSGSNSMTVVSLTGISVGNTVTGPGIPTGTYVTAASVLTVTLSQNATSSNVSQSYTFAGNNWFCNNISLTAGTTYDSMTDVPTLTSATTANYCTWNPLENTGTLSNGNLTTSSSTSSSAYATMWIPSGKFYFENTIITKPSGANTYIGTTRSALYVYNSNGNFFNNGSYIAYGATYTTNDVIGCAIDTANGTMEFFKNGTSQGQKTGLSFGSEVQFTVAATTGASTGSVSSNFGQQPWQYAPPTGFVALNTYNLPTSTIVKGNTVMDATLWSGNASSPRSITNTAGFKPDLVWSKVRNDTYGHMLFDSVRGAGGNKELGSNSTGAEGYGSSAVYGYTSSFNSNGFTVTAGTDGSNPNAYCNQSGLNYVGWQWQAGQGTTSSNTSGSITSTVSVNASAGFSVVTYTGNGSSGATVGHGLGVKPAMIITKSRTSAESWEVWNSALNSGGYGLQLRLNTTDAAFSAADYNGTPTSTTFTLGGYTGTNGSGVSYVSYCWTPISNFSSFGSYTGNGSSDGTFVYLGFRPRFVMFRRTDAAEQWAIRDTARDTYNASELELFPNLSNAEEDNNLGIDLVSNGFKIRNSANRYNASGGNYIYMAFAENPFKNALAR